MAIRSPPPPPIHNHQDVHHTITSHSNNSKKYEVSPSSSSSPSPSSSTFTCSPSSTYTSSLPSSTPITPMTPSTSVLGSPPPSSYLGHSKSASMISSSSGRSSKSAGSTVFDSDTTGTSGRTSSTAGSSSWNSSASVSTHGNGTRLEVQGGDDNTDRASTPTVHSTNSIGNGTRTGLGREEGDGYGDDGEKDDDEKTLLVDDDDDESHSAQNFNNNNNSNKIVFPLASPKSSPVGSSSSTSTTTTNTTSRIRSIDADLKTLLDYRRPATTTTSLSSSEPENDDSEGEEEEVDTDILSSAQDADREMVEPFSDGDVSISSSSTTTRPITTNFGSIPPPTSSSPRRSVGSLPSFNLPSSSSSTTATSSSFGSSTSNGHQIIWPVDNGNGSDDEDSDNDEIRNRQTSTSTTTIKTTTMKTQKRRMYRYSFPFRDTQTFTPGPTGAESALGEINNSSSTQINKSKVSSGSSSLPSRNVDLNQSQRREGESTERAPSSSTLTSHGTFASRTLPAGSSRRVLDPQQGRKNNNSNSPSRSPRRSTSRGGGGRSDGSRRGGRIQGQRTSSSSPSAHFGPLPSRRQSRGSPAVAAVDGGGTGQSSEIFPSSRKVRRRSSSSSVSSSSHHNPTKDHHQTTSKPSSTGLRGSQQQQQQQQSPFPSSTSTTGRGGIRPHAKSLPASRVANGSTRIGLGMGSGLGGMVKGLFGDMTSGPINTNTQRFPDSSRSKLMDSGNTIPNSRTLNVPDEAELFLLEGGLTESEILHGGMFGRPAYATTASTSAPSSSSKRSKPVIKPRSGSSSRRSGPKSPTLNHLKSPTERKRHWSTPGSSSGGGSLLGEIYGKGIGMGTSGKTKIEVVEEYPLPSSSGDRRDRETTTTTPTFGISKSSTAGKKRPSMTSALGGDDIHSPPSSLGNGKEQQPRRRIHSTSSSVTPPSSSYPFEPGPDLRRPAQSTHSTKSPPFRSRAQSQASLGSASAAPSIRWMDQSRQQPLTPPPRMSPAMVALSDKLPSSLSIVKFSAISLATFSAVFLLGAVTAAAILIGTVASYGLTFWDDSKKLGRRGLASSVGWVGLGRNSTNQDSRDGRTNDQGAQRQPPPPPHPPPQNNNNNTNLPPRPPLAILIPSITLALILTVFKIGKELSSGSGRASAAARTRS